MTDIDLSAAIEAAAREIYAYNRVPDDEAWPEWDALVKGGTGQQWQAMGYRDMARRAFAEFAPIIEAQVRAQIGAEIETVDPIEWALAGQDAGRDAARIARGDS